MGPEEFEHVLAAAADVTGQDEFVVIGSQAILGSEATKSGHADEHRRTAPSIAL